MMSCATCGYNSYEMDMGYECPYCSGKQPMPKRDQEVEFHALALSVGKLCGAYERARVRERDLAMIVGRLCSKLPRDDQTRVAAMDFLKRHDLIPSPLRTHEDL